MSEPVNIRDASAAPDKSVIEVLETFLAMAKSGELRGVVVIANCVMTTDSQSAGIWNGPAAMWALECWKHRFLHGIQSGLTHQ